MYKTKRVLKSYILETTNIKLNNQSKYLKKKIEVMT